MWRLLSLLLLSLLPTVAAYYEVTLRELRVDWFRHPNLFVLGSALTKRNPGECYRYNNLKKYGGEIGMALYNRPPSDMATALAFYTATSCGSKRGSHGEPQDHPHYKLAYVAVLDPNDLPGVYFINFQELLGVPAEFLSYRSIDYAFETMRGGLLVNTDGDPKNVVYAYTEGMDGSVSRDDGYVEGVIEKITGPEADVLDQLTDERDIMLGVKDLAERAVTPGSEDIPNTVLDYFMKVLAGYYANGEPRGYLAGGLWINEHGPPTLLNRPRRETLRRLRADRNPLPEAVQQGGEEAIDEDVMLAIGDEEAQAQFLQFLELGSNADDELTKTLQDAGDETPDDQRLVKAPSEPDGFGRSFQLSGEPAGGIFAIKIEEDLAPFEDPSIQPLEDPVNLVPANAALADMFEFPVLQDAYPDYEADMRTNLSPEMQDDISVTTSQFFRNLPPYDYGMGLPSTSTVRDRQRQPLIQPDQADEADGSGNAEENLLEYLDTEDEMPRQGSYEDYEEFNAGRRRRLNPN
ncbi:hypothetical protein TWF696_009293 [Orbilia brochopaga]|uniref:Uncharacterized protein n=1 Tax=Orbilia brochopaga TaxID=3140254 RepID=A0AAV9UFJ0_9PEZI